MRQLNTGDYYEQWISGVQSEAKRLKIKLDIYNANGDNARQALFLQQAVASKPDAIVVGWGIADTVTPGLEAARDACIPIVAFYVLRRTSRTSRSSNRMISDDEDPEQLRVDLNGSELSADVIYA